MGRILSLKQHAIRAFLEGTADFDIVLIDCPPNLYQSDT